jgi:hypothetical protein
MNRSILDSLPDDDTQPPQLTLDQREPAPAASQARQEESSEHSTCGCKQAPFVAWQLCEEN